MLITLRTTSLILFTSSDNFFFLAAAFRNSVKYLQRVGSEVEAEAEGLDVTGPLLERPRPGPYDPFFLRGEFSFTKKSCVKFACTQYNRKCSALIKM